MMTMMMASIIALTMSAFHRCDNYEDDGDDDKSNGDDDDDL